MKRLTQLLILTLLAHVGIAYAKSNSCAVSSSDIELLICMDHRLNRLNLTAAEHQLFIKDASYCKDFNCVLKVYENIPNKKIKPIKENGLAWEYVAPHGMRIISIFLHKTEGVPLVYIDGLGSSEKKTIRAFSGNLDDDVATTDWSENNIHSLFNQSPVRIGSYTYNINESSSPPGPTSDMPCTGGMHDKYAEDLSVHGLAVSHTNEIGTENNNLGEIIIIERNKDTFGLCGEYRGDKRIRFNYELLRLSNVRIINSDIYIVRNDVRNDVKYNGFALRLNEDLMSNSKLIGSDLYITTKNNIDALIQSQCKKPNGDIGLDWDEFKEIARYKVCADKAVTRVVNKIKHFYQ